MNEYKTAVTKLCRALEVINATRPTVAQTGYKRMRDYVDQSWEHIEQTRLALKKHLETHNCANDPAHLPTFRRSPAVQWIAGRCELKYRSATRHSVR